MRIVAGKYRGRKISTPPGRQTRPTSDQARESIFNILAHVDWAPTLDEAIIADIFAGSGALGLEALSRGAEFCLFVETDPQARAAIRQNIENMNLFGSTRLHRHDATKLKVAPGNLRGTFSHIFIDPPYHKGLWKPVIMKLHAQKLITTTSLIILEISRDEEADLTDFTIHQDRSWGAARVLFLSLK